MRKMLFTAILFMMVAFAALNCVAQSDHQIFTLKIDGKDAAVNLPKEVPDMKDAWHITEKCFDAHLCVDHYAINEEETLAISFWHHRGDIVGFVLHALAQGVWEHTPWFYEGGAPASATAEEFNAKLAELYQSAE